MRANVGTVYLGLLQLLLFALYPVLLTAAPDAPCVKSAYSSSFGALRHGGYF